MRGGPLLLSLTMLVGPLVAHADAMPTVAESQPAPPKVQVLTLGAALKLADDRAPQIKMAKDRVVAAHAQLDEIKWIPWSQFSVSGGVAYVPEVKGNAIYSPTGIVNLNTTGNVAARVTIDGVVPLWTFGKISASQEAAKAQVDVALADVERTKNLLHHDLRRAFFGLQLAHDARYLLDLAKGKLVDAIKHAEENPDTDDGDLLRMKTYLMEIQGRYGEVEKGERQATAALRFFTGIEAPKPLEIPEEPIAGPKKPLSDVLVYLNSARLHRPELKQAGAGIKARTALVDYAKARLFPDIGLGLSFGYSMAPSVTIQTNAFTSPGGNYLYYSAGLVFRWNLDLLPGVARLDYAKAQLAEVQDLQTYALGGVGVEVETAYGQCKDAMARDKAYGEAEKLAKKWVSGVSAAISVGTKEDKDLVEPLRAFLTNRYNHLVAIMDLDVATSSLMLATGDESFTEF
ncbi:MAG: TolC family protein [Myxococcales bacterium]|nr:TolC family protein [Myxococcales bacterium]